MGFSLLELHTCVLSHFSSSHAFHWVPPSASLCARCLGQRPTRRSPDLGGAASEQESPSLQVCILGN